MYRGKHVLARRRRSALLTPAILAALLLLAVAIRLSGSPEAPSPEISVTTSLKPAPVGLYMSGHAARGVHGVFLNVPWSALENADQSFVGTGWSRIDSALAEPGTNGVKLRVMAGMYAPDWLKNEVGSVRLDTRCCGSITVPEYWTPEFQLQYQQLMVELAGRYDSNPKLLSVTDSACMTANAEPFIKGGPDAGAQLYAAGDTQANELYCFQTSMATQMAAFSRTRTDLAGHLAWQIPAPAGVDSSWADERDLVDSFLEEYGDKLIFQDNGLATQRCSTATADPAIAPDLWCFMKAIGGKKEGTTDIGFQRGCGEKVSSCSSALVIQHAIALGACWFEHANYTDLTVDQVRRFTGGLRSNPGCTG
jgi:hypothetical protein